MPLKKEPEQISKISELPTLTFQSLAYSNPTRRAKRIKKKLPNYFSRKQVCLTHMLDSERFRWRDLFGSTQRRILLKKKKLANYLSRKQVCLTHIPDSETHTSGYERSARKPRFLEHVKAREKIRTFCPGYRSSCVEEPWPMRCVSPLLTIRLDLMERFICNEIACYATS
ncbi:hypothetical protein CDAR_591901 [Caerostris darwini]|uniref:Ribosomal protein S14 n=1 Tax=Caerostris darwini TaxID=1538125 RepID=A0AAV4UWZ4_9ARAC|nr:hypothetical protein CDAR_591901 [Caerostris darwini]